MFTIFLSKLCAVVTSLDTTNALTGAWLPKLCAIWFWPEVPTTLKLGAAEGTAGAFGTEPPPPPPNGVLTAKIDCTDFKPPAIAIPALIGANTGPTIGIPTVDS